MSWRRKKIKFYPLQKESDAISTLSDLFYETGVPRQLHCDNARVMKSQKWKAKVREAQSYQTTTEPHSPFQNRAEGVIKTFKRKILALMKKKKVPERFWDYVAMYVADIHNLTSSPLLDNRSPREVISRNTSDIFKYKALGFYETCMF